MRVNKSLLRKSHFLGTKIRNLRKRNHLTMEDLSTRCVRIDPEYAPSVSYLSMVERGKRVPSVDTLRVIASVFQKELDWFLDDQPDDDKIITPDKGNRGGLHGMPLEPSFLFNQNILQIALPELLNQTGTTGREFAHLLIRAHQEHHQNHFPDLERAAEEVGQKRMPLSVEELMTIVKQQGITLKWFDEKPSEVMDHLGVTSKHVTSSFFAAPKTLHLNRRLKQYPNRLKYELAVYIGRAVLHNRDSMQGELSIGGHRFNTESEQISKSSSVNPQDILHAWQDFESSFFAGALLCPKLPYRQLLDRHGYEIATSAAAQVSDSVAMRRMTAVSPYPHWHYFDAYTPGKLKAVYRGNGIPLPWGNMRQVDDPCRHWAVFNMFNVSSNETSGTSAQLSIMEVAGQPRIYCCESKLVTDMATNKHVLCAGLDLNPALEAQGKDAFEIAQELKSLCVKNGGATPLSRGLKKDLTSVAKVLNVNWIERSLDTEAKLICTRGGGCPRTPGCYS